MTKDELKQVRALSSRARISATHFVNEYQYGNFRGNERKLVEQLYDAHLYFAHWGSRRLMLRLPTTLLPARSAASHGTAEPPTAPRRRSAAELLDAAHEVRSEHTRQQEQARRAEQLARESRLDHLAENAEQAWQDIANLIGQKQPGPYDNAVTLLKDLREVHDRTDTPEEFARRLHDLRDQHRAKSSLMRRLTDAGLTTR
ncbi:hypothetical protein ACIBJC_27860 [Streptomyces sp. NPDC050509]|uniref:hypothetical protein n=1 Tax=Streptomyces sp. NPDC050509 TaxID=3365620 RepID=UPI0037AC92C9